MDFLQAIITGIVQGLTEFLPVSSSGHIVITSAIYKLFTGVPLEAVGCEEIFFDIMLHLGTLFAILIYFKDDLVSIFSEFFSAVKSKNFDAPQAKLPIFIAIGTVATVFVAFPLKDFFEGIVSHPYQVGYFLFATAGLLLFTEMYSKNKARDNSLSVKKAILIGCAQGLAAAPGLSRSGSTIAIGLMLGLDRVQSARYSFLLSIPIIILAALYHSLEVIGFDKIAQLSWGPILVGTLVSAVVGYFCIKYFLIFLNKHSLNSFAFYCLTVGILTLLFL